MTSGASAAGETEGSNRRLDCVRTGVQFVATVGASAERNGVPLLPVRKAGVVVTPEIFNPLRAALPAPPSLEL